MSPQAAAASAAPSKASIPIVASQSLPRTKVWGETDKAVRWAGAFATYGGHGATASSTIVYEIEPGGRLGWHTDATEETQYIIAGSGRLYLEDGSTHEVGPGSVFVLPTPMRHDLENTGKETLRAVASMVANTALSVLLVWPPFGFTGLGFIGIAIATSIAAWVNAVLLGIGLRRRGHWHTDPRLLSRTPRVLLASVLMGAALVPMASWLEGAIRGPVAGRIGAMAARHPIVKEVRGRGLMWGIELSCDAAPVVPAALERGVIVNRTAERVVRLLPPLVITEDDAAAALDRLDQALGAVAQEGGQRG